MQIFVQNYSQSLNLHGCSRLSFKKACQFAFKTFKGETGKAENPGADSLGAFIYKSIFYISFVKIMSNKFQICKYKLFSLHKMFA